MDWYQRQAVSSRLGQLSSKGVQCYLDDIIVLGATAEEHDKRLIAVLRRIQDAGLKLNH